MFGLPTWAVGLIISSLQKAGAFNWAELIIAKALVATQKRIEKLQTYQDYPKGKNTL